MGLLELKTEKLLIAHTTSTNNSSATPGGIGLLLISENQE